MLVVRVIVVFETLPNLQKEFQSSPKIIERQQQQLPHNATLMHATHPVHKKSVVVSDSHRNVVCLNRNSTNTNSESHAVGLFRQPYHTKTKEQNVVVGCTYRSRSFPFLLSLSKNLFRFCLSHALFIHDQLHLQTCPNYCKEFI